MFASDTPDDVNKALVRSQPRKNVRKWGEIKDNRAIIRASCRRCGTYGEFEDPQYAEVFEDYHNGAGGSGVCPHENDETY